MKSHDKRDTKRYLFSPEHSDIFLSEKSILRLMTELCSFLCGQRGKINNFPQLFPLHIFSTLCSAVFLPLGAPREKIELKATAKEEVKKSSDEEESTPN